MEVSVVYAAAGNPPWIRLNVPEECTLGDAIAASGLCDRFPDLNLKAARVGIFGKLAKLDTALKPGDRVEIYRPITRSLDDDDDDDD
ncbi:RnfH family protein [Oceanobacter mangrovi]|uniref:RnfH family protein n=1 Tax=Oceanobacter mangrovi TaxID=2862510 RepID=UPI001C8D16F1|nr:RnfH family protein [Oceanobacter mangrovi]